MNASLSNLGKLIKSNAPEILTALGASGVVTTSYLAAKGGYQASRKLSEQSPHMDLKERARRTWKCYIPAGISGAVTIGCILAAGRGSSRRAAAAATAYSLTERAFNEYREKVVEQIGANKEQKIRDEIVQDRVTKNPPSSTIVLGAGDVLCQEEWTGRYFESDMETLRKAMNDVNSMALSEMYVSLNEFYDRVGLPPTSDSDLMGWNFEKQMELQFSTSLTPDGKPVLTFSYSPRPKPI